MSLSIAVVAAVFVVFSVAAALINRGVRRREAERAEEYRKAAALRGWRMELDAGEYRCSGSTEGVPWVAHVVHVRRRPGGNNNAEPLRWGTTSVRFDGGAMVIWPDFGQGMAALGTPGVPQFVLDLAMRPVAWALGATGGDAAMLAEATEVVDGPKGFLYRATHGAPMREWLDQGAAHALEAEAKWLANQEVPRHLVVAVLWRHGLQIVTPYGTADFDHIAALARVGARLASAAARTERVQAVL